MNVNINKMQIMILGWPNVSQTGHWGHLRFHQVTWLPCPLEATFLVIWAVRQEIESRPKTLRIQGFCSMFKTYIRYFYCDQMSAINWSSSQPDKLKYKMGCTWVCFRFLMFLLKLGKSYYRIIFWNNSNWQVKCVSFRFLQVINGLNQASWTRYCG